MESALHVITYAAPVWLVVLAVAVAGTAALGVPTRRPADPAPAEDDAHRYADEIAIVADRAAATARRRRTDWERADRDSLVAWAMFDAADRAVRRCRAADVFPVLCTPVEAAECERYLHRSATAACRRRELSVADLNEVLAHRGWDPRRHPLEQQTALRELVRDSMLRRYLDAAERERRAWHAADVAAAAVRSLRDEAFAARERAEERPSDGATAWLDAQLDSQTIALPVLRSPQLASR